MNVIGYVRVSTSGQADDGVSMDAQRAKIMAWADLHGHVLQSIHADAGISGSRIDKRPGLLKALDEVEHTPGSILIVYSLSRMSRSIRDTVGIAERLKNADCQIASIVENIDTSSAGGKMVFNLLAVFAEFERDLVIERTKTALDHKRQRGEALGNTPYGWRNHRGMLAPDEQEQHGLAVIADQLREGITNCARIARELDARGIQGRCGYLNINGKRQRTRATRWHAGSVRRIVAWMQSDQGRAMLERVGLSIESDCATL